jgi:hypothetical protein
LFARWPYKDSLFNAYHRESVVEAVQTESVVEAVQTESVVEAVQTESVVKAVQTESGRPSRAAAAAAAALRITEVVSELQQKYIESPTDILHREDTAESSTDILHREDTTEAVYLAHYQPITTPVEGFSQGTLAMLSYLYSSKYVVEECHVSDAESVAIESYTSDEEMYREGYESCNSFFTCLNTSMDEQN